MKAVKIFGTLCVIFALLCLTGYDCPDVNFKSQTIALGISVLLATICGLIVAKNDQRNDL